MMDEHFAVLFGKGEHQSPEPEPEPLPDGAIMAAPSQSDLARKAGKATVESPKEAFKPPKPPPVEARVPGLRTLKNAVAAMHPGEKHSDVMAKYTADLASRGVSAEEIESIRYEPEGVYSMPSQSDRLK